MTPESAVAFIRSHFPDIRDGQSVQQCSMCASYIRGLLCMAQLQYLLPEGGWLQMHEEVQNILTETIDSLAPVA